MEKKHYIHVGGEKVKTVVIINNETMGHGDKKLGLQLMGSYLKKVWASDHKPHTIVFYNSGVKLLARGSSVIDVLDGLEKAGVELLACGTCLDFYNLEDYLLVGQRSNMEEIVGLMSGSNKVITI